MWQNNFKQFMKNLFITLSIFTTLTPILVFAQDNSEQANNAFVPLVNLGLETNSFDALINSLYALSITIAALLAVVRIIIAGVKWMTSGDNASNISSAKSDIRGAIIGLIIILAAVMILSVFNDDTVNFNMDLRGENLSSYEGSYLVGTEARLPGDTSAATGGADVYVTTETKPVECVFNGYTCLVKPGTGPGECVRSGTGCVPAEN